MKFKKLLILASVIVLILASVCAFAVSAETAPTERNLKIAAKNLSLEDSIYVLYAVPVADTVGADSVKMLFWLDPQSEYTYGTQDYTLAPNAKTEIPILTGSPNELTKNTSTIAPRYTVYGMMIPLIKPKIANATSVANAIPLSVIFSYLRK